MFSLNVNKFRKSLFLYRGFSNQKGGFFNNISKKLGLSTNNLEDPAAKQLSQT